jgi:hypothetical protein
MINAIYVTTPSKLSCKFMLYNTISLKNPDFLQKTLMKCIDGAIKRGDFSISPV